jgi:hypothetical protein
MHLSSYLGLLETGCATLAKSYRQVAEGHSAEADVRRICQQFAAQCDHHEEQLRPFTDRYGSHPSGEPERLHADGLSSTRSGGLGLLRISMICICWPATLRRRGWWLDRPPRGVVIKS